MSSAKKAGLILASIHSGSSRDVWEHFAKEAIAEKLSLFIFPGGKLNAMPELEYLRNSVYALANSRNLDALISWSSSIGFSSDSECSDFHRAFENLPVMTVADKVSGYPLVGFDAYNGMKALTARLIEQGARNIAFLRGPETHHSAADRYLGFKAALAEAGIPYNEKLVSDPFGWQNGMAACMQLVSTRGLLPEKDFDTLLGSSDLMTLPALQYLNTLGFSGIRAGGFNNTIESRVKPFSTVAMPYSKLSRKSFKILKALMKDPSSRPADVILPCTLVDRNEVKKKELTGGGGVDLCDEDWSADQFFLDRYERETRNSMLNSLKCELLGIKDRRSLVESLSLHLPKIGIYTAAIVLYKSDKLSECIGSFSSGKISIEAKTFPAEYLFPPEYKPQYRNGIFLVQPLFIENESLGYFVHTVPFFDGLILEELRSVVSNAFKGIFLFEESLLAKQRAEQSERRQTDFFISIGDTIDEPFRKAADAVERLEKNLDKTADGLRDRLSGLLAGIKEGQSHVQRVIELTVSQFDEVPVKRQLFNIRDLLPDLPGVYPLLQGDKESLSGIFSIIKSGAADGEYSVAAAFRPYGLELTFDNIKLAKHTHMVVERIIIMQHGRLALTESSCSILLPWPCWSGQTTCFDHAENSSALLLSDSPIDVQELFGLQTFMAGESVSDGKTALVVWDTGAKNALSFTDAGRFMLENTDLIQTAFLCFSGGLSGESIMQAASEYCVKPGTLLFMGDEKELASPSCGEVLSTWIDAGIDVQKISFENFVDAVSKTAPDIICMGAINIEMIKTVRNHPATSITPVIFIPETVDGDLVSGLSRYSRVVLCHRSVAASPAFCGRVRAVADGDSILPFFTGAQVKKAIYYLEQNAHTVIFRWKLGYYVGSSEDYLTRIFHREMGISLWGYLNHYRIAKAIDMLVHSGDTIAQIAKKTGFSEQAYFCRVFKKVCGKSPAYFRK